MMHFSFNISTTILASIAAMATGQQQHLHLRNLQIQLPPSARGGHGIVMDAGSSKTEMKTLYWDVASPLDAPIEIGKSQKVKPGISSFKDDLSKVSDLLPLLEQARLNLDEAGVDWTDVPLFLGATGGMRLLPTSDRMAIMATIRSFFRDNGFRVDDDDWVRVISGAEEGAFGWLTVNLSLKTLDDSTKENPVGLIDIGGASVQLTYLSKLTLLENNLDLDIVDYDWNLYSQSFLYFGNTQANKQYAQKLVISGKSADPCYAIGGNNTVGMPGYSDPSKCKEAVKSMLPLDVPCFQFDGTECSMLNEYLPNLVQENVKFFGTGLIGHIWETMQLAEDADLQDLENKTDLICAMNMTELVAKHPDDPYITGVCFSGLRLPKKGTPLIVGKIGDWAPGFFVNEMNDMKLAAVKDVNFDSRPEVDEVFVAEVGTSASFEPIPSWTWIGIASLMSYQMFIL
eukprot:scaffold1709_cov151-Skeletonema_menzelii.AAC.12